MLRLTRLSTYSKRIRRNARTGETEVEALDVNQKNPMQDIKIPDNGYILKPNEVYIAEVSNPTSEDYVETNFATNLSTLGIECRIVGQETLLTVRRPIKIYKEIGLFYEKVEK